MNKHIFLQSRLEQEIRNYHPDMELSGSGNIDYGHVLADRVLKENKRKELGKNHEDKKMREFIEEVEKSGVNINDEFKDRYRKIELLGKLGYTALNGKGKEKIPLRECSDYRIGAALKNIYLRYLNNLGK